MVLCETPWDMDSSMTWANINHMGPYATSREPKHLDVSSTAPAGNYYLVGIKMRDLAQRSWPRPSRQESPVTVASTNGSPQSGDAI